MLDSFLEFFAENSLSFPIVLTLKACAAGLLGSALVTVPLALYTARRKTVVSRIVLFLCTLPLIFPPVALGFILLLVFGTNGPVGSVLYNWFGYRLIFSETAVCLAAYVAALPLVIRPVKAAFESGSLRSLEEASRVCGAGPVKTFLFVTVPAARNAVLSALLLAVARGSGEVGITMMLGGNVAGRSNTLSLEIFNAVGRGDFDSAMFLCVVLAALALALYAALEFVRGGGDV